MHEAAGHMSDRRRISIASLTAGVEEENRENQLVVGAISATSLRPPNKLPTVKHTNLVTGYTPAHQVEIRGQSPPPPQQQQQLQLHEAPPSVPSLRTFLPELLHTVRPRTFSLAPPPVMPVSAALPQIRPIMKRASVAEVPPSYSYPLLRRPSLAAAPSSSNSTLLGRRQSTASSHASSSHLASDSESEELDEHQLSLMGAQEQLKYSHKLAERKRRREMKVVFDALRLELPNGADQRLSKWEILSKMVDYLDSLEARRQALLSRQ